MRHFCSSHVQQLLLLLFLSSQAYGWKQPSFQQTPKSLPSQFNSIRYHLDSVRNDGLMARWMTDSSQSDSASFKRDVSSFEESSPLVKGIVGGLTAVVNSIFGATEKDFVDRTYKYCSISPGQLKDFIQKDFERGYLFSGEINPEIYCEDCSFTDPTISFEGLSTFEANIKNLKPILDRYIGDRSVQLYSIELDEQSACVRARWRMWGEVLFPWRPHIALTGKTAFSYDAAQGGRVTRYYETWDSPALQVLLQLLYPGAGDKQ